MPLKRPVVWEPACSWLGTVPIDVTVLSNPRSHIRADQKVTA